MPNPIMTIDCDRITNEKSFHDLFAEVLGFLKFYGRNMNAWIDCMTRLDAPEDGMTKVHVPKGGILVLQLDHVKEFAKRCPMIYDDIIECSAFVNWSRIERGQDAVLALSFYA